MRPSHGIRLLLLAGMALALAGLEGTPARAQGDPRAQEILQLNQAAQNPATAGAAVPQIRGVLAGPLEPDYVPLVRGMLVTALMRSRAPARELLSATDSLLAMVPETDTNRRVYFMGTVADALAERGEETAQASKLAARALAAVPAGEEAAPMRAAVQAILGRAQLANGETAKAIATLTQALPVSPESAAVLYHLGRAHEKTGAKDQAIAYYVRSLGVFPTADTTAYAPLRALYQEKHKSLAGLDQQVTAARKASRKVVALDGARHERPAPSWKLQDLAGKDVASTDFKGQVMVVDFWGSWCGPCRMEMPLFQAAYEKYRTQGVAFIGINWERANTKEGRHKAAKDFVDQNRFTFPVVLDHDYAVSTSFSVQAFPSLYVIDKNGRIRYRNVGFHPQIDALMTAQIESLLEE